MWEKFKEIPGVIVSILAISTTLITVVAWTINYFATQKSVEYVKCFSSAQDDSLANQIQSTGNYIIYLELKRRAIRLDKHRQQDPDDVSLAEEYDEVKRDQSAAYAAVQKYLDLAKEANERKDKCSELIN